MQEEPDPPRKVYGFKPRDFERANPKSPGESPVVPPVPDPGVPKSGSGRIDVKDLIRAGAAPLGSNSVGNRPNDVHAILQENLRHDLARGHFDLGELDDSKRRRRIWGFWIALILFDTPFAVYAAWIGHGAAIPFVCAIAAIALFTSYLTWQTFFLRTHY